jgi:DNA-binding beta-propeller fold protein YncE
LCASISENALYFVQKDGWTPKKAYKYDIDNNLVTELVSDPNGYMFYGAGLTVNPKNGYVYATLIKGYGQDALSNTIIIVNGETKETVETIDYSGSFWFPSQIVQIKTTLQKQNKETV